MWHKWGEKCIQEFGKETWIEEDHLEYGGIDGRIILKRDHKESQWEGVGWIHVAQDRKSSKLLWAQQLTFKKGKVVSIHALKA